MEREGEVTDRFSEPRNVTGGGEEGKHYTGDTSPHLRHKVFCGSGM